ncbi:hypothetical protein H4217_003115 [Coemansia sp. RSA 1939]|nr:hypothetical protein H4217_003115 [Coemansia sp. RSA 1939]KAJ2613325.1 hypothetical protein EV177_002575 [Coemansia sp. RSA 1804]KAJ2692872.1 hypothetical protein GGH99_001459 [Coemansia sp. RSA 1285]
MMDFGYGEDPVAPRYDSSESEDESVLLQQPSAEPPTTTKAAVVVRLSPSFARRSSTSSSTVVISLLPLRTQTDTKGGLAAKGDGPGAAEYTQVGVVYAPVAQTRGTRNRNRLPVGDGKCMQTNSALARIVQPTAATTTAASSANDQAPVVYVVASSSTPLTAQHAWIRAVAGKLQPARIVVVDAPEETEGPRNSQAPAAMVVGLAAAVLNYADTHGVPCRHVRLNHAAAPSGAPLLQTEEVDALFDEASPPVHADSAGRREAPAPASFYV